MLPNITWPTSPAGPPSGTDDPLPSLFFSAPRPIPTTPSLFCPPSFPAKLASWLILGEQQTQILAGMKLETAQIQPERRPPTHTPAAPAPAVTSSYTPLQPEPGPNPQAVLKCGTFLSPSALLGAH